MVHWTCTLMAKRRTLAKGDDDPEIKKDIKVDAVQLVNDVKKK